jgi:cell division protein ZapA (FtsZ GTPase activity inhibitor)
MGSERWLIMAALNMANELAKLQVREERSSREMGTRVRQMRERVERALVQGQQLEL